MCIGYILVLQSLYNVLRSFSSQKIRERQERLTDKAVHFHTIYMSMWSYTVKNGTL